LKDDPELLEKINVVKTAKYGIAHITFVKLRKEGDQE
jgi:hypothetical protein